MATEDSYSVKLTAYGYPGDSTPDSNSLAGIGDHDNDLSASPDHQSVALTVPERELLFGHGGHSTGQEFQYGGKTYYDDDTAPEGDYRIDVYSPNHAPDKLTLASGHEGDTTSVLSRQSAQSMLTDWENADREEAQLDEKLDSFSKPKEKPADKKVGKEDNSILSPQNMLDALRKTHPEYIKVNDQKLWDSFKQKYPTGLEQLRAVYPQYAKADDNKFLKAIKEKYFKDDSDDEFTDRINPPSGVMGLWHSMAEQAPRIVSGWFGGTSEVAKFPDRMIDNLNKTVKALGIKTENPDAKVIGPGGAPLLVHPAQDVPGKPGEPQVAGELYNWAKKQAAKGQQWTNKARIPQPQGVAGQIAAKGFEGLGASPAIVPSFMPGVEAAPALVLGMIYDAVQGEGKAREKGLDNSMMFGAEGASYRALQQWLMFTPRGRVLSALLWAGGGMADQEAQALLTDPKGELNRAFSQPANTAADLISTGAVNALFGSIASMGVEKFKPEAAAAFEEAQEARESGDYKAAAQLLDKTMLLLPEPVRKAATNNLLAWRNEAIEARPGDEPMEMPGQRGFLVLKGRMSQEPFLESQGTEMRTQDQPEPKGKPIDVDLNIEDEQEVQAPVYSWSKPQEEPAPWYRKDWGRKGSPADIATDEFYYSGIDIGKAYDALGELFAPEHKTVNREKAGAVIGEQIRNMQMNNQRMAQSWYRKQQLEDWIKFGYEADQRRAFWASIKKGTLMKMFEQHEAGHSTGNRVADRLFKLHDGLMRAQAKIDQARGFTYKLRESYIYHALEKPEDIDKLAAEIRRRKWGDPDFMRAREIPTVEMLHALGFKLKTYNLEDLDQMRIESSNRAQMRAASLDNLRAAGQAVSRFDIAKMEKYAPNLAAEIRAQVHPDTFRSPRANGDDPHMTFWLHKDAAFMLKRAADPIDWHPVANAIVQSLGAIKQRTVGMNLAFSAYHHLHTLWIAAADSVSSAFSKSLAGTANLADWGKALEDTFTVGMGSQIRSLNYNQKLLNWYLAEGENRRFGMRTGKGPSNVLLKDLSTQEQKMFELQQGGGFLPLVSEERQISLMRWLVSRRDKIPNKPIFDWFDAGYAIATSRPYQQWLFGRAIPSMKMYSYDRAALALLEAHPEFNRPQYRLKRNIELRKIRDQVDARYGEQNMRQSFADPVIKAVGQVSMLSYSWMKSFIDVYGGGIHDTVKFAKDRPETPQATNRIAYLLTLSAMTSLTGALVSQFIGSGFKSLQDAIYPNIGMDKDGKHLARVKPPFWITTEVGGLAHDIEQKGGNPINGLSLFFSNKMQPAISTILGLIYNKDYYQTDISPAWDNHKDFWTNFQEQVWSKAEFALKQSTSFTLQEAFKPGAEAKDVFLQMLGVPRAPAHAERTGMENRIIREFLEYDIPAGKRKNVEEQMGARRTYREAIQSGNVVAQDAARIKMQQLGITEKSIQNIEKTANETEAQRLFGDMKPDEQSTLWKDMSPQEQAEFRPFLHKKLRDQ